MHTYNDQVIPKGNRYVQQYSFFL